MNNKQLLIDTMAFDFKKDMLFEEALKDHSGKRLIVKGVLQRAGSRNQNGRIYPRQVLEREAQKYNENFIKERRALGELDHSASEVVNLKNVSHNIIETHWEGNDLVGTLEILPTPNGEILRELFKANIRLGISSRGLGSVEKSINEGADVVQDDYSIITYDFVSNPSVQGAFMFPVGNLQEGINTQKTLINRWKNTEDIIRCILSEIK